MTSNWWDKSSFGATGLRVSRIGLGSSYGLPAREVERAFERGVNFFFWGLIRRPGFGEGVTNVARRRREDAVVAVQSYTRAAVLMRPSLEIALRRLKLDYVDLLTLGWWNAPPPRRILDAALALKDSGKVRHLAISCHNRPAFAEMVKDPAYGVIMVRYNASHPGAEEEVFSGLGAERPGVLAFTATRWGTLLRPALTPPGEKTPGGSDCYRFALTHPAVDACLAGVKDGAELDEAMRALDRGAMSAEELAWMKRVGAAVKRGARANTPIKLLDRAWSVFAGLRGAQGRP
jgi:aryl-alcohol dehydrogenase-like predicted oxidoreductase